MIIREVTADDADKLSFLIQQVDDSSRYMLWEKGERNILADNLVKMIESLKRKENATILVAEAGNGLIGYMFILGGDARRQKHSAYIVIGILKECRGKGVGSHLFNRMEHWALNHNLYRLELTVAICNEAGISLYKKMGFEIEGTKKNSLLIDGKYHDEYYMAKIL